MVKGRQHDQAFDETLEFVLAAGESYLMTFFPVCPPPSPFDNSCFLLFRDAAQALN